VASRIDKLYVEVNAETKGFESGMNGVDRQLARFAELAKGAPLVAAAAFGSSLLLIGNRAQQMAREVDAGVRQAAQSMPSLLTRTGEVRKAIEELSLSSGRAQAELARAFATAAETGVESFGQLNQVVRTAVRISEATGQDVQKVIGGLDLALDGFGISAARAADVGARLFAVAQGRFGFDEITSAIQPLVPILRSAGVGFEVMTAALGNLLAEGKSPQQAAKELKAYAAEGEAGAEKIRVLAGEVATSAENFAALDKAVRTARESADSAAATVESRLSAVMIRLGNRILPVVAGGLEGIANLLDRLSGAPSESSNFIKGLADSLPGDEEGLRNRITQTIQLTEQYNEAIRRLQGELAGIENTNFGVGAKRARELEQEIAGLQNDVITITNNSKIAQDALKDLLGGGGSGTGTGTGTGTGSGTTKELKAAAKALEELAERAVRAEEALGDSFLSGLAQLNRELTALQERAAAGGAAALEQAQSDASRILDAYLKAAEASLTDALTKFTEQTGAAARDEVVKTATALAKEREQFAASVSGKPQFSGNLDADFADTLRYVRELLAKDQERVTYLQQQGRAIREAVDGTLDLLNAFGLVDDRTANILGNIAQLGSSLPAFAAALQGGVGIEAVLQTALPVAGGLAQIIGSLGSLGGPSEELLALRQAVEDNRQALITNSERLAELRNDGLGGTGLTGEQLGTGRRLRDFQLPSNDGPIVIDFGAAPNEVNITEELARLGISMDELRDLADALGLDFVELTSGSGEQFLAFLDQVNDRLNSSIFGSDLEGRLDRTRTGFGFADEPVSGPAQFRELIEAAGFGDGFSSLIADAFSTIDWENLDTTEVQDQLRGIVRDLFGAVTADGFNDFEALGEFTGTEFIAFLQELLALLPEVEAKVAKTAAELLAEGLTTLGRAFRVFDFTTLEQAQQFLETLAGFSPELAAIISGFDLSSVEGIDAGIAALQAFYQQVEDGEISLEGTGITVDLLVDAIDRLQGASAEAAAAVARAAEAGLAIDDNLRVRNLRAAGEDEAAAAEQRRLANEAEVNRARANGVDEVRIAAILETQALEEEAIAKDAATKASERAADAARRAAEQAERDRVATGDRALRQLSDEFRLFGITSPQEQLQQRFNVLNEGSNGLFGRVTGGADLSDPTGQAAALEALKQFFLDNPEGVDAGFFGADAVRGQALELAELIKAAQELNISESGGVEAVGINRTISEVTGDRMAGLLGSQLVVAQDQLAELRLIRALLTPGSVGTLTPPSLTLAAPSGGSGGGTTVVSIGTIELNLNAGGTVSADGTLDIPALTQLIAEEIVRQVAIQKAGG
jgi:hypothetical protein